LYVSALREAVGAQTSGRFKHVTGYLVADRLSDNSLFLKEIAKYALDGMYAMDWSQLLANSLEQHKTPPGTARESGPDRQRMLTLIDELDDVMKRYGKTQSLTPPTTAARRPLREQRGRRPVLSRRRRKSAASRENRPRGDADGEAVSASRSHAGGRPTRHGH
jgi:hypothetical protein